MVSRLDSRSLALFLAVADAGSLRHAAERLHLSQPPLSRAIRDLEERLGCKLFERSHGGMQLTEAGRTLRPYALKVEKLLREAQSAAATHATASPLRLGLTSAVEPAWFALCTSEAFGKALGREVRIVTDTSPRLVRGIRAGRLDAACIALPTEVEGLHSLELDRLPMVVALSSKNPLARRRRLHLADLQSTPLFWFDRARQPAFHDHCERVFERHGFAPRRLAEPTDHHVLLASVVAGQGIALVPASFAALRRAGLAYRPLAEGDELSVGIGWVTPEDSRSSRDEVLAFIRHARKSAGHRPRRDGCRGDGVSAIAGTDTPPRQ